MFRITIAEFCCPLKYFHSIFLFFSKDTPMDKIKNIALSVFCVNSPVQLLTDFLLCTRLSKSFVIALSKN